MGNAGLNLKGDSMSNSSSGEAKIPGINMETALTLYDNDMELYTFILRSFVKNVPGVLKNLHTLSEDKIAEYAISIHSVKGNFGSIGAEELASRAKAIEAFARAGELSQVQPLNTPFIADTEDLIKKINAWLPEEE